MANAARKVELIYDVPSENERWLLEDEDVLESPLHDAIILLLVEILIAWQRRVQRPMLIGRNIALRWNAASPRQGVDPDVYVIEPPPPEGESVSSICTWKLGHHPPRVAVEVVSESTGDKDYVDGPERYAASGTVELWVFDPLLAGTDAKGGPHRLQIWRRDPSGAFRRVYAGSGPGQSEELGAWLVVTDAGRRLRIAQDADGTQLWPTGEEEAQAEVARLREELARLRQGAKT